MSTNGVVVNLDKYIKSDKYEELLEAVINNDEEIISKLLQYNVFEAKQITSLLWKILSSIEHRDPPYHFGVTILRGVIEDWSKNQHVSGRVTDYEKLFRSIISLSDDWKSMNACKCPSVRTAVIYWHKASLQIFAEKGMNLSACKDDGESLLHLISSNKRDPKNKLQAKKLIEMLMQNGCDINAMSQNWTPLHNAVSYQRNPIVEILIELGADVNVNNESDWPYTPLLLAILSESEVSAKILIAAGANVNSSSKSGRTPLYFAVEKGDIELVNMLLKRGANVNFSKTGSKSAALHVAASEGYLNIVQKLINAGAYVNVTDENGRTPMHFAAQLASKYPKKRTDHAGVVDILIKSKADVNTVDKEKNSPLHIAANSGSNQIVYKLLKSKVVHHQKNSEGMTALHVALHKRWLGIAKQDNYNSTCNYQSIIVMLIKAGVEKVTTVKGSKISQYFGCLLYLACAAGDAWSVKLLMDNGADVNVVEHNSHQTPLHAAIKNNQMTVMKELINGGAKVNVKDIFGKTPLHMATYCLPHQRIDVIPKLLKAGARTDLQDNEGLVPLDMVINNNDVASLKCLLEMNGFIDIHTCYQIWKMPSMRYYSDTNVSWIWEHLIMLFAISSNATARHQFASFTCNNNLNKYYKIYSVEVNDLKTYLVGDKVSLYDILNMKTRRRCIYIKNIDLKYCAKKFPRYHELIKYRCQEANERKLLIESAKSALCKLVDYYLPDVCVEYILDFLLNIQLQTLIRCELTLNKDEKSLAKRDAK